ncbi:MAG: TetR/AcrR family transcriptional regulator [Bacteroidota bacterium]
MPLQKVTRQEIILGSIQVFRRRGYYRTSMSDLAKELNLTKGAFYHHFSNKETVMLQALDATTAWFRRKIFSVAYEEDLTAAERLRKMGDYTYRAFTDYPGGCFFANTVLETSHVEDTFIDSVLRFFGHWENALINILKESKPLAQAKADAQKIIADIEGSIILMQLYKDPSRLKQALDRGLNFLNP